MFELDLKNYFQQVILPFPENCLVESQPMKQWNPIRASATEGPSLS